jgi:methionyl-tRNA formyltransferase
LHARGKTLKVHATRIIDSGKAAGDARTGRVLVADKTGIFVACGQGVVELARVQPEGKRAMLGSELAAGRGIAAGDTLGAP